MFDIGKSKSFELESRRNPDNNINNNNKKKKPVIISDDSRRPSEISSARESKENVGRCAPMENNLERIPIDDRLIESQLIESTCERPGGHQIQLLSCLFFTSANKKREGKKRINQSHER